MLLEHSNTLVGYRCSQRGIPRNIGPFDASNKPAIGCTAKRVARLGDIATKGFIRVRIGASPSPWRLASRALRVVRITAMGVHGGHERAGMDPKVHCATTADTKSRCIHGAHSRSRSAREFRIQAKYLVTGDRFPR